MRYPIAALLTLTLTLTPTLAQGQGFGGLKLGASFSKLSIDGSSDNQSTLVGFDFGPFFWYGRGPVALQAEVLWVTKGEREKGINGIAGGEGRIKLSYVEVP